MSYVNGDRIFEIGVIGTLFLQVRRFLISPDLKKEGESRDQKNLRSLEWNLQETQYWTQLRFLLNIKK